MKLAAMARVCICPLELTGPNEKGKEKTEASGVVVRWHERVEGRADELRAREGKTNKK